MLINLYDHVKIIKVEVNDPVKAEAVIRYHLLDEKRRKRISYENITPIDYEIFKKQIMLKTKWSN